MRRFLPRLNLLVAMSFATMSFATLSFATMSLFAVVGSASAAEYSIDPAHSTVGFKIKHMAISSVAGQFGTFEGTINFDPKEVQKSSATAVISASSINTQNGKRDDHLRSPDFFDVAKFPELKFVSKEIKNPSKESFQVIGDLTLHGVTLPVTLDVEYGGEVKDMQGKERVAFAATGKLNRKDFGLTWSKLLETGALVVGDEVKIEISVEAVKK